MIKMIVAASKNNVIGKADHLPWNIPNELQFFKKITTGHTLLWGRKTFINLPKKLENRRHYVITTTTDVKNADKILKNNEEINKTFEKFRHSQSCLIICGGKSIYEQFYQQASQIYWSKINKEVDGDVSLNLDLSMYEKSVFLKNDDFTVFLYNKRQK